MVLKSHRGSAPGHAFVPSTLCRFSIVPTLPLSAAFHVSGRRPDPTSGCWREQGGGITTRCQPIRSVRRAPHSPADGRRAWRDNVFVERLWRSVEREPVPIPCNAERPLPDAWRTVSGRSQGKLQREQDPKLPFVFTSERGSLFTTAGFARMLERAGEAAWRRFRKRNRQRLASHRRRLGR